MSVTTTASSAPLFPFPAKPRPVRQLKPVAPAKIEYDSAKIAAFHAGFLAKYAGRLPELKLWMRTLLSKPFPPKAPWSLRESYWKAMTMAVQQFNPKPVAIVTSQTPAPQHVDAVATYTSHSAVQSVVPASQAASNQVPTKDIRYGKNGYGVEHPALTGDALEASRAAVARKANLPIGKANTQLAAPSHHGGPVPQSKKNGGPTKAKK